MSAVELDLNADLGEGFGVWRLGDDEALLDVITSANVACGFHAGDPLIMRRVCIAASERGVTIGAQVSYRDLAGFGRRRMEVEPEELVADILYQLGALDGFARAVGTQVRYVKPHGALYNAAADDPVQAEAVATAVATFDPGLPVLAMPGSALAEAAAAAGLRAVAEAFADRAYQPDGRLVPRSQDAALVHDLDDVVKRALALAHDGTVTAIDGSSLGVRPQSLCVHGDTPGAVQLAAAIRRALDEAGIAVRPFAP